MAGIFDEDVSSAPVQEAPPQAPSPAVPAGNIFDADIRSVPPPAPLPSGAVDWSKYNQPFGELKPNTPSLTEYAKQKAQDAILAAGAALGGKPDPYMARQVGGGAVNVAGFTPMGSVLAAGDVAHSLQGGQYGSAAIEAAGVIPGVMQLRRGAQMLKGAYPAIPMADVPKVNPATGVDELKAAASSAYDRVRDNPTVFHPAMLDDMINEIRVQLTKKGLNPAKAPSTFGVLDAASAPKPRGAIVTPDDLDTLRQQLRGGVPGTQDSMAGNVAVDILDSRMAKPAPQHVISGTGGDISALGRDLAEARGNYRAYKTADTVEGKIDTAAIKADITHSGGNLDNTTRQYLAGLLTTKTGQRALRGATADEKVALEQAARGDALTNTLRYGGKLLGGGGGLGQFIASSTGGGVGGIVSHALGADPMAASGIGAMSTGATMLGGIGLRSAADARTTAAARGVADLIRTHSPEYAARAAIAPPAIDPFAMRRDAIAYAMMPQAVQGAQNVWDTARVPYANRPQE